MKRQYNRRKVLPVDVTPRHRLDGLKLISQYLEVSHSRLKRMLKFTVGKDDPIPLWKLHEDAGRNAQWSAWVDELDAWMDREEERQLARRRRRTA